MYEYISTFHVPVQYPEPVQSLETPCHLYEYPPYVLLFECRVILLMRDDLLVYVPVRGVLHHDAQALLVLLDEGLFVADHVRVPDRGQDADLVQSVFSFFLGQGTHIYLLNVKIQGILLFLGHMFVYLSISRL